MNILMCLLLIIILLYSLELGVCSIYCTKKKAIDSKKRDQNTLLNVEVYNCPTDKKGIPYKIKQLLNGYVLYRVGKLGKVPCQSYRIWMLKHIFKMDIARNVVIYHWDTIRAPWNISIGEGTVIGDGTRLDGRNFIIIGSNVNISTDVNIYTEQHDIDDPYFRSLKSGGKVVIDNRVWISSHTTILPNVHVEEGAVLASNALAVKDLEAFSVYGGVPCRKIGERSRDLRYEFVGEYLPFF